MRHRVFIAINLPEKIKNRLIQYQEKWPELPLRWIKKENLHITLEFLGYLTSEEMVELCQKTRKIASGKKSFCVNLNKICYGPPNKKTIKSDCFSNPIPCSEKVKIPKMIWAMGEKIKQFNLSPHITLARIKAWQFRQMEKEEIPEINEEIDLTFEVNSIEVMESQLKKNGPEYTTLKSIPLKKK